MKYANLIPDFILKPMARRSLSLPTNIFSNDFQVKTVDCYQEYYEALGLLHDCYVQKGLMAKDPRKLRLSIYHLLPETNIMIVKHKGTIVGTGTIIHKGSIPLPVQKAFPKSVEDLAGQHSDLIEFSGLAVHPDYRQQGHVILLLLAKYFFQLSNRIYENPYSLCTVHPNAQAFYKILFNFKRIGKTVDYDFVQSAKAVFMAGSISTQESLRVYHKFAGKTAEDNILLFLLATDERMTFPRVNRELIFDPDLLRSLQSEIYPQLFERMELLSEPERQVMGEILCLTQSRLNFSNLFYLQNPRSYRLRTLLRPLSHPLAPSSHAYVTNISQGGFNLQIQDEPQIMHLDKPRNFTFSINGTERHLTAKIVRVEVKRAPQAGLSLGFEVVGRNTLLEEIIKPTQSLQKVLSSISIDNAG